MCRLTAFRSGAVRLRARAVRSSVRARSLLVSSYWFRQERAQSHEVVRGGGEREVPIHEQSATMMKFAHRADRFHPAEGLFDELPFPLADVVARVSRGPRL